MIKPHGGKLINRFAGPKETPELKGRALELPGIFLDRDELMDVENIATGLFSPLEGFMGWNDYKSVLEEMRLENGLIWTIPVVLGVSEEEEDNLKEGNPVGLYFEEDGELYAILELEEKFRVDKDREAELVYKTRDKAHPGVNNLFQRGEVLLGGRITMLKRVPHQDFPRYRLTPAETRELFNQKGWKTVVGFQTRNPIHRAHEYLQKCALEFVDGLFLSPLVGLTADGDLPSAIRIKSYEVVMEKFYPVDRTTLGVFPVKMFYAGPREAIFHALCRKNYGCTHFIVGRDHAGIGNYYGPLEAREFFDQFPPGEIGITPLKFDFTFYCKKCGGMASQKTCPHSEKNHVFLSGTKVRELLIKGEEIPEEMTRPEVARVLREAFNNLP